MGTDVSEEPAANNFSEKNSPTRSSTVPTIT